MGKCSKFLSKLHESEATVLSYCLFLQPCSNKFCHVLKIDIMASLCDNFICKGVLTFNR